MDVGEDVDVGSGVIFLGEGEVVDDDVSELYLSH